MSRQSLNLIVISFLTLLFLVSALASALAANVVGTVTHIKGPLFAQRSDGLAVALESGSSVEVGQVLITGQRTFARIKFIDGSIVTLRPNTQFKVEQLIYREAEPSADQLVMDLVKGGLRAVTGEIGKRGNQDAYQLTTPTATLGIRGTIYEAKVCRVNCGVNGPGSYYHVLLGLVAIRNPAGELLVGPGEYAFAAEDFAPVLLTEKPPLDFSLSADDLSAATDLGNSRCICDMR